METTLELKQSLLSTIDGIEDRNIIMSISNFVKKSLRIAKPKTEARPNNDIEVAPEVWNIIRRVHPVDIKNEKKEYYEHLNRKYQ